MIEILSWRDGTLALNGWLILALAIVMIAIWLFRHP